MLDFLDIKLEKKALPAGWFHTKNLLIENLIEAIRCGEFSIKVRSFIFNKEKLQKNDIVFMKYHGKFAHHVAIYEGENHVIHCMPLRGVCRDLLRDKLFVFGVRIWE